MSIYNNLASLLTVYFCNEFYEDGIKRLKHDIEHHENYAQVWEKIVISIQDREFLPGQPLELIHCKANQMLDENTDEEAYKWLDLMVQNVQQTNGEIESY